MKLFWITWAEEPGVAYFELLWPWWVTGRNAGRREISAAIMAADADAVRRVVLDSYDLQPSDEQIGILSVEERDFDHVQQFMSIPGAPMFVAFTDRNGLRSDRVLDTVLFPRQRWMPNFGDPEFDPVDWTTRQASAAAASKARRLVRLARDAADIEMLSSDNPKVVLLDDVLPAVSDLIADAVAGARASNMSAAEIVARSIKALDARMRRSDGFIRMEERALTELPHGTFVLAGDPAAAEVYVKSSSGCFTLDGVRVDLNPFDTRIVPVRMIGAPPTTRSIDDEKLLQVRRPVTIGG